MKILPSRALLVLMSACLVAGQRPSFAGFRPIGFPDLQNKTSSDDLGNRFGDDGEPLPLPVEAKGDRDLVNRISKLPIDKQPFWYINWKALEENRRNPQTYEQRPNVFVAPVTSNSANVNRNQENTANLNTNQVNTANLNTNQVNTANLNTNQVNTANLNTNQEKTANLNTNQVNTANSNFNDQANELGSKFNNDLNEPAQVQTQAQAQGAHIGGRRHSHRHY